ncbi:hypothetical protein [Fusarium asiaticum negative-stranded RNA virus 1]|uniref:Uncharacterized protein n=1 Tax=Fusarium asiaticum negative-stranded RNA virus 1 TaxID=2921215 RepID=A0AA46MKB0_9MONO|nr:hypothetical protein QKV31_gp1 [Fusarium asiaticum negative-stranded RNA virus 1]UNG44329.1 hypothetical protein [Fusarium asiaticum negative-stranded RNA virus 1]
MSSNQPVVDDVSSGKKDIEDYDLHDSHVFSKEDVTDENLMKSLQALQGIGTAASSSPPKPVDDDSVQTVKVVASEEEDSQNSARTEFYSRDCIANMKSMKDVRDVVDSMMDTIEAFSDRSKLLQRAQKQQAKEIDNLKLLVDAKNATVSSMQKIIDKQQERIKEMEEDLSSIDSMVLDKLDKFNENVKARIQESNEAVRQAPDLIERILDCTNQVIAFLPDDIKKTTKEVKLTETEQQVMTTIRSNTKVQKKKLPKHLR